MIRYLLARFCRADWTAPPTIDPIDQTAALHELAAWEQQIRADERHRIVRQENTAAAAPPRRIGLYTEIHG